MLSKLKIGVAKRKLGTALKKSLDGGVQGNRRVGIILDSESEELKDHFMGLLSEIGLLETDYKMVICKDEGRADALTQGLVFTRKDLTWNGRIRNGDIFAFAQQKVDILITFTETDTKLAALLTSVSDAKLKVGRMEGVNSAGLYDMVITTGFGEPEIFIKELKKYLRILNLIEDE